MRRWLARLLLGDEADRGVAVHLRLESEGRRVREKTIRVASRHDAEVLAEYLEALAQVASGRGSHYWSGGAEPTSAPRPN